MPARYHFDLESGHETIRDETGVEADDLGQAIEQAVSVIEEVRKGGDLGETETDWELVIRSNDGTEVKRIPI